MQDSSIVYTQDLYFIYLVCNTPEYQTFFIKKNYRDEWGECETSKEEDLDYEEY